jgi:hypothetical protein
VGEFSVLRCACIEHNITYTGTQMVDVNFSNACKRKNIKILEELYSATVTFSLLIGQSVLQQHLLQH